MEVRGELPVKPVEVPRARRKAAAPPPPGGSLPSKQQYEITTNKSTLHSEVMQSSIDQSINPLSSTTDMKIPSKPTPTSSKDGKESRGARPKNRLNKLIPNGVIPSRHRPSESSSPVVTSHHVVESDSPAKRVGGLPTREIVRDASSPASRPTSSLSGSSNTPSHPTSASRPNNPKKRKAPAPPPPVPAPRAKVEHVTASQSVPDPGPRLAATNSRTMSPSPVLPDDSDPNRSHQELLLTQAITPPPEFDSPLVYTREPTKTDPHNAISSSEFKEDDAKAKKKKKKKKKDASSERDRGNAMDDEGKEDRKHKKHKKRHKSKEKRREDVAEAAAAVNDDEDEERLEASQLPTFRMIRAADVHQPGPGKTEAQRAGSRPPSGFAMETDGAEEAEPDLVEDFSMFDFDAQSDGYLTSAGPAVPPNASSPVEGHGSGKIEEDHQTLKASSSRKSSTSDEEDIIEVVRHEVKMEDSDSGSNYLDNDKDEDVGPSEEDDIKESDELFQAEMAKFREKQPAKPSGKEREEERRQQIYADNRARAIRRASMGGDLSLTGQTRSEELRHQLRLVTSTEEEPDATDINREASSNLIRSKAIVELDIVSDDEFLPTVQSSRSNSVVEYSDDDSNKASQSRFTEPIEKSGQPVSEISRALEESYKNLSPDSSIHYSQPEPASASVSSWNAHARTGVGAAEGGGRSPAPGGRTHHAIQSPSPDSGIHEFHDNYTSPIRFEDSSHGGGGPKEDDHKRTGTSGHSAFGPTSRTQSLATASSQDEFETTTSHHMPRSKDRESSSQSSSDDERDSSDTKSRGQEVDSSKVEKVELPKQHNLGKVLFSMSSYSERGPGGGGLKIAPPLSSSIYATPQSVDEEEKGQRDEYMHHSPVVTPRIEPVGKKIRDEGSTPPKEEDDAGQLGPQPPWTKLLRPVGLRPGGGPGRPHSFAGGPSPGEKPALLPRPVIVGRSNSSGSGLKSDLYRGPNGELGPNFNQLSSRDKVSYGQNEFRSKIIEDFEARRNEASFVGPDVNRDFQNHGVSSQEHGNGIDRARESGGPTTYHPPPPFLPVRRTAHHSNNTTTDWRVPPQSYAQQSDARHHPHRWSVHDNGTAGDRLQLELGHHGERSIDGASSIRNSPQGATTDGYLVTNSLDRKGDKQLRAMALGTAVPSSAPDRDHRMSRSLERVHNHAIKLHVVGETATAAGSGRINPDLESIYDRPRNLLLPSASSRYSDGYRTRPQSRGEERRHPPVASHSTSHSYQESNGQEYGHLRDGGGDTADSAVRQPVILDDTYPVGNSDAAEYIYARPLRKEQGKAVSYGKAMGPPCTDFMPENLWLKPDHLKNNRVVVIKSKDSAESAANRSFDDNEDSPAAWVGQLPSKQRDWDQFDKEIRKNSVPFGFVVEDNNGPRQDDLGRRLPCDGAVAEPVMESQGYNGQPNGGRLRGDGDHLLANDLEGVVYRAELDPVRRKEPPPHIVPNLTKRSGGLETRMQRMGLGDSTSHRDKVGYALDESATGKERGGVKPSSQFYFGMNGASGDLPSTGVRTAVGKVKDNEILAQPFRKPRELLDHERQERHSRPLLSTAVFHPQHLGHSINNNNNNNDPSMVDRNRIHHQAGRKPSVPTSKKPSLPPPEVSAAEESALFMQELRQAKQRLKSAPAAPLVVDDEPPPRPPMSADSMYAPPPPPPPVMPSLMPSASRPGQPANVNGGADPRSDLLAAIRNAGGIHSLRKVRPQNF